MFESSITSHHIGLWRSKCDLGQNKTFDQGKPNLCFVHQMKGFLPKSKLIQCFYFNLTHREAENEEIHIFCATSFGLL